MSSKYACVLTFRSNGPLEAKQREKILQSAIVSNEEKIIEIQQKQLR